MAVQRKQHRVAKSERQIARGASLAAQGVDGIESATLRPLARLVAGCFSLAAATFVSTGALAQVQPTTPAATDAGPTTTADGTQKLDSIMVTARRRSEALVDVPLAISVITSKQMQQLDLHTTNDLSYFVPGLEFNDFTYGNLRNDRGTGRALVFRGLAVGTTGAYGGTMFLNGAAVLGNEIPANSMDIGQVEVLRGPQSVYFGRATETGAVSYRTKPISDAWSGAIETSVAQRNAVNISASVSGSVLPGLLKTRFTVLQEKSDGWANNGFNNGTGQLGDRERKSFSNTLEFTPLPNLSFKTYFNTFRDSDGPSQTSIVPQAFANCVLPGQVYKTFCGAIPDINNAISYRNTVIPTATANYLFSPGILANSGFKSKTGQQAKVSNADLVIDWDINDYLHFQSITGYHTNLTVSSEDFLGYAGPLTNYQSYFYAFIQKFNDFSQELRLSSSSDERLSWTIGANYVKTDVYTASPNYSVLNSGAVGSFNANLLGQSIDKTLGAFGGVYFKVTPELTASLEGRRQANVRVGQADTNGLRTTYLTQTFKSNSPRASLDLKVAEGVKVYTSFATGNRPGGFNTTVLAYQNNPAAVAQINSLLGPGAGNPAFDEEKLRIGEIGIKGETSDRRGYFDVNAYVGKLVNQQIMNSVFVPVLNTTVSTTSNAGESKIHGVEAQGGYAITPEFSLNGTFAWNYTERTRFLFTGTQSANGVAVPRYGVTDLAGKKFPLTPEFSGSLVGTYTVPLGDKLNIMGGNLNFYTTLSAIFRGKQYVDLFNSAYIKSRQQYDLRAGLSNRHYTLEAFIKNLANDKSWTGGQLNDSFFLNPTASLNSGNQSFYGGWVPPRQIGVRLRAEF